MGRGVDSVTAEPPCCQPAIGCHVAAAGDEQEQGAGLWPPQQGRGSLSSAVPSVPQAVAVPQAALAGEQLPQLLWA